VTRIQLATAVFEGANNAYLIDDEVTTLVDTAVAIPSVRSDLEAALRDCGVSFADIDAVVLTHWHPDHAGLAGEIQAAGDATVFVHEADAPIVSGREPPITESPTQQRETFDAWGMPAAARDRLTSFFETNATGLTGRDPTVTTLVDGERIELGEVTLETVHLPGHTAGLCGFAFDPESMPDGAGWESGDDSGEAGARAAFVGDAVLPQYTPNVGGADVRVSDPLGTYLDSLDRILKREWTTAYPGHREPIATPGARAAETVHHHRDRTERVVAAVREEPATAWEVSATLFGELTGIHTLHGPGEAFAHLEHLTRAGITTRDGITYRLVEPEPDLDAVGPSLRR